MSVQNDRKEVAVYDAPGLEDAPASSLVSGIVADTQELFRKELQLARQEIREELTKAKDAAIKIASGGGVLAIAGLLLILAVAQLIADLLNWPAWAGYGIVSLVLAAVGYFLLSSAQKEVKQIKPVPEKTAATMKENVEWVRDRITSGKT